MADDESSEGGSRVFRHAARTDGWRPPTHADADWIAAIERHMEAHVAPVDVVLHEIISDLVHIDVHVVPAEPGRDHHVLFTTGCSALAMNAPEGACAYAELMILLPAYWKLDQADWRDERWYWPIRWLKILARLPHEYQTWIGWGHTVPNGDPPQPFDASTRLCAMLLLPSLQYPDASALTMPGDGREIVIWTVHPLYPEELDYKLRVGTDALIDRFEQANLSDVIDPDRPPLV